MTTEKKPLFISLAVIILVNVFMVAVQGYVSLDQFFLVAVIAMLCAGRAKEFVWDWLPFVVLFLVYRYLRGLIPVLNPVVNIWPMITVDRWLFGELPTVVLQRYLFVAGQLQWYDWLATSIYLSHYFVSFIVLLIFWIQDKKLFKQFGAALLLLSYASFITYMVYPAMPPWMASEQGYIEPITKILATAFASFPVGINVFSLYQLTSANLVAAVPSLHAAYPVLLYLFVRKMKWWNVIAFLYVIAVWFSIVYLGEHYVVDALLGGLYACITYWIVINWRKNVRVFKNFRSRLLRTSRAFVAVSRDTSAS